MKNKQESANLMYSNFLIKNKRGDAAIVFLVFMVLILFVFALYTFASSTTVSLDKFDLSSVQKISSTKFVFENSLYFVGRKAMVKTFEEFSSGNNFDYIKGRKDTGEFESLHDKLKESFALRFKQNFLEIFSSQTAYDESIRYAYEMIKKEKGNFDVSFDNDNITIKFNYLYAPTSIEGINVQDSSRVEVKIPLNKIGLNGFNEIYLAKEKCKLSTSSEEMENCFESKLINFDISLSPVEESASNFGLVSVSSTANLNIVQLTSKSSFSFSDGNRKITFFFVPK